MKKLKKNIDKILKQINEDGIAEIVNFLNQDKLSEIQEYIYSEINNHPKGYSGCVGKEAFKGTPLEKIDNLLGINEIIKSLYLKRFSDEVSNENSLQVLRVQSGGEINIKHANMFHYDAYLLTALLPIIIPNRDDGLNGDFIYFKQRRHYHKNLVRNIIEKLIIQNPFTRYLLSRKYIQNFLNIKICKLKPGNLYLFYGFQTIHGNALCNTVTPRATMLFHFSDPMNGHFIVSRNERNNRTKINKLNSEIKNNT